MNLLGNYFSSPTTSYRSLKAPHRLPPFPASSTPSHLWTNLPLHVLVFSSPSLSPPDSLLCGKLNVFPAGGPGCGQLCGAGCQASKDICWRLVGGGPHSPLYSLPHTISSYLLLATSISSSFHASFFYFLPTHPLTNLLSAHIFNYLLHPYPTFLYGEKFTAFYCSQRTKINLQRALPLLPTFCWQKPWLEGCCGCLVVATEGFF